MKSLLTLIIMPWGRVGSNLINSALAGRKDLKVYNETLTGIETRCREENLSQDIARQQMDWLDENLSQNKITVPTIMNHAAISTGNIEMMAEWIRIEQPNLIALDRTDDAAVALSVARAEAWIKEGQTLQEKRNWAIEKSTTFLPYITPETLLSKLEVIKKGRSAMKALLGRQKHTKLYYEDLLNDTEGVMISIMKTAGLPWQSYQIKTAKFGDKKLSKMVSNPDEIFRTISDHFPSHNFLP